MELRLPCLLEFNFNSHLKKHFLDCKIIHVILSVIIPARESRIARNTFNLSWNKSFLFEKDH